MKWIRILDKLPPLFDTEEQEDERSELILLLDTNNGFILGNIIYFEEPVIKCRLCRINVNNYVSAIFMTELNWCLKHFTHWTPLPELPK